MKHDYEKTYFEYLAKLLLETFIPDQYCNLSLSDRPDLRMDDHYGIEVSRATIPGDLQARRMLSRYENKKKDQVDPRHKKTLQRNGFRLLENKKDGVVYGVAPIEAIWINDSDLKNAYLSKKEKYKNYQDTETVDLFLYTPLPNIEWYEEGIIHGFLEWVKNTQDCPFKCIIVFEEPFLYHYFVDAGLFRKIPIDGEKLRDCCKIANDYTEKRK